MFSISAIEFYERLNDLITEQSEWSQKTFGSDYVRGPEGVLKHLAKEANEAINEWKTVQAANDIVDVHLLAKCIDNFKEEMADCLLLLLDAMRRSKVLTFFQLVECAYKKLQKNMERNWPKNISLTEPVEHSEKIKVKPVIVCLCGSTKFMQEFQDANMRETLDGKIVLSVGMSSQGDCKPTEEQKKELDKLHLRKIDLAQEVLILNKGGYVGTSTKREVLYAKEKGKTIRWLVDCNYEWLNDGINKRKLVYSFMELPYVVRQQILSTFGFDNIKADDTDILARVFQEISSHKEITELMLEIDYAQMVVT